MKKQLPDIQRGTSIVQSLMQWLDIPVRDGTKDTPERVAKMYLQVFNGMYQDKPEVKMFVGHGVYDCVTDINVFSMCEHHLLPFFGKCGVVYWTESDYVLGYSKIPRIVNYYASRPQIQERLTAQIAEEIMWIEGLKTKGVYVAMSCEHTCMIGRGVKACGSRSNTAIVRGDIDKDEAIRLLTVHKFFKEI